MCNFTDIRLNITNIIKQRELRYRHFETEWLVRWCGNLSERHVRKVARPKCLVPC